MRTSVKSAPAGKPQHRLSDLDHLQGTWKTVAGRHEARLLIAGRRFTFEFCDKECDVYMGTFELDPDAAPKHMDMYIAEGPAEHRGRLSLCVYELDGGILRWCPARPGATSRLSRFPSVDDDKYLSLVFKRQHPRRVPVGA